MHSFCTMGCTENVLPIAEYFCFVPAVGRPLIYYQVYFPSSVNHFPPHLIPSSVIPFIFLYYAFPIFNEFTIATLYEIRHCYLLHFSLDLPQLSSIVYITKMLFWWLSCYVFPLIFQLCRLWESLFFWLRSIFFKAYGLLWSSFLSCCLVFGGPSTYFLDSFFLPFPIVSQHHQFPLPSFELLPYISDTIFWLLFNFQPLFWVLQLDLILEILHYDRRIMNTLL